MDSGFSTEIEVAKAIDGHPIKTKNNIPIPMIVKNWEKFIEFIEFIEFEVFLKTKSVFLTAID